MLPLAALSRCARRTPVFLDPFCCPRARFTSSVANPQPLIGMLNADLDALPMHISLVALEGRFTTKTFLEKIWENMSQWFIKRTFQPSVIRKRRKQGFLTRQKTVGGRRVLKRRLLKGRKRLGGC